MARKLEDVILDVTKLDDKKWSLSVEIIQILTSRILALEGELQGLKNVKFNYGNQIEVLETICNDLKKPLNTVITYYSKTDVTQSLADILDRIEVILPSESNEE